MNIRRAANTGLVKVSASMTHCFAVARQKLSMPFASNFNFMGKLWKRYWPDVEQLFYIGS